MATKKQNLLPKKVHNNIVNQLIRNRTTDKGLTAETSLLCYGSMQACIGNRFERKAGARVITSVLRRNGLTDLERKVFLKKVSSTIKPRVAEYLLTLQPHREVKSWLKTEAQ